MNETQGQSQPSRPLTWVVIALVVLILIVLTVVFILWRDRLTGDENGNTNAVNQTSNTSATNTNSVTNSDSGSSNTNTVVADSEVLYANPQFGYSVRYADPDRSLITTSTSNTAEQLYSGWTLESGEGVIIAIDVFPKEGAAGVFTDRGYAVTDDTVELGNVTANILTIDGVKKGYRVEYGNYVFVLRSDAVLGDGSSADFETIAKTFLF